jgi:hypothetical protein
MFFLVNSQVCPCHRSDARHLYPSSRQKSNVEPSSVRFYARSFERAFFCADRQVPCESRRIRWRFARHESQRRAPWVHAPPPQITDCRPPRIRSGSGRAGVQDAQGGNRRRTSSSAPKCSQLSAAPSRLVPFRWRHASPLARDILRRFGQLLAHLVHCFAGYVHPPTV